MTRDDVATAEPEAKTEEEETQDVLLNPFFLKIIPDGAAVPETVKVLSDETFSELISRLQSKGGRGFLCFPKTLGQGEHEEEDGTIDTLPYQAFRASTIYAVAVADLAGDEDDDDDDGDDDEPVAKVLPAQRSVVPKGFAVPAN